MVENMKSVGILKDEKFYLPIRVYYEDTDAGGVVYYANYLRFAERARTEFLRALGVMQNPDLAKENPCAFVVRRCEIDYKSSAFLDDFLTVVTEIEQMGGVSVVVKQTVCRDEQILATLRVKVAYVSVKDKKILKLPPALNSWYAATMKSNDKNCDNTAK